MECDDLDGIDGMDNGLQDLGLPVPVQTFLWRQIIPFIRPKLGKLHEASCMFCQNAPGHHELKEACKSFEKVLVQNIQFGLSPSLTTALQAIPRWRLVQAALPHVMHCAAALLHNRVKDLQTLGATETKMLYTLHWILLFAAEECADADMESSKDLKKNSQHYLFSVPTISVFVYLFAPLVHHMKESDFQNFRLENGIKIWQGMWEYRSPGATCFVAPVKPRARQLMTSLSAGTSSVEVFPGRKPSSGPDLSAGSPQSISISDALKHDDDGSWVSSPKDFIFPETIPEEASSVEEERVVIFRLPPGPFLMDPSFYTADASLLQQSQSRRGSKQSNLSKEKYDRIPTKFDFDKIENYDKSRIEPKPKTSSSTEKDSIDSGHKSPPISKYDINAATFLDVGVLRCLFISHWHEEGVYWSLHYLYNRLREISEEASIPPSQPRKRSNSLPIPQIEISLYQGPSSNSRDSPSGSSTTKDYIELPEQPVVCLSPESPSNGSKTDDGNNHKKRKMKMTDFRAFVETKMFSKSERALEKIGIDVHSDKDLTHAEYHSSLDTGEEHLSRSTTILTREPNSNLVKGKSMPSLRYVEPQRVIRSSQSSGAKTTFTTKNPIITVTEHTPIPSPDFLRRQGSIDSQLDAISNAGSTGFRSQMLRSHTDSHIAYSGDDESEAPGSSFYITKEGGMDYEIIILSVYSVFKRDSNICSLRVLEAGLNICELLLDLGILKLGEHAHNLLMGIIKRALLHLGCPHGCNDGIRGPPAEFLRTQCHSILSRLLRQASSFSKIYLRKMVRSTQLHELIEFFHAFIGFCVDPSSLLSPLNHKRTSALKTMTPDGISGGQGGYSTNFGSGLSGSAESQVMSAVFKTLVSRFVESFKDLKGQENIALYCDIRQLVTYVKGAHGGPFRKVALSGILAVTPRPNKKAPTTTTTRVIRHIQHHESQNYPQEETRSQRRLFFKKRSTSSTCASLLETDILDEQCRLSQSPLGNLRRKGMHARPMLTPRHSERALLSDSTSSSEINSVGRLSGIVRWFRGTSKDRDSVDLEAGVLGPELAATFMRQGSLKIHTRRAGDGIGRSIQRARKRVERRLGRFGIIKGKKKIGGTEEVPGSYFSRRTSFEFGDGPRESEVVVLKERRLVPIEPVRMGMLRFSFLLEICSPGSVPDAQLVAALLDLPQAPVITRAALLLECAHFVHLCNRGQWPSWMKQNIPSFRPSGPTRAPLAPGARRTHVLQRAAGKMFYQWADALGSRLEDIIATEKQTFEDISSHILDPEKQRALLQQDEEEDFLDEASVNPNGNDCPQALKLIATVLLFEITAFLRETYQTLPKTSKLSTKEKTAPWEKVYREANRRWSMALSSMGHSQTSAQSLQSIAGGDASQTERKISFVLHEPDNEGSEGSSNTTLTLQGEDNPQRRQIPPVRPYLLRRGTAGAPGGSFKRRSLKLRRGTKDGKDMEADCNLVKRTDSIQSRRKVSSLSDRSDTSEPGAQSGGEESPGILSDDQPPESPSDSNETGDDTGKHLPWTRAALELTNSFNFYCTHQNFCHPYCYRRHMRAATRLMKAVRKVYGEEFGVVAGSDSSNENARTYRRDRNRSGRKVSEHGSSQSSPSRRKDSVLKRDKIVHDETDQQIPKKTDDSHKSSKDTPLILKYLKNHVRDLFHIPMATLVKAAAILTEEQFIEAIPAAWELLLETNQETAASAAAFFILGSVRAPNCASDIMQRALKHRDPNIKIGAILRYQVLWKCRFQVWPRMEEGAHLSFKIPPPGIEFTLPSPKIGIESLPVVDPPWSPRQQTKDMEVTLNQERHRSLVTATKTRKKQQTEAIRHAQQQQIDKQRAERQSFLITTIPITQQGAHEPGLDHAPGEDHVEEEEGSEGARAAPHLLLHAAHSLFPSILCSAGIKIVACLDDAAVSSDGCSVYEVAYQVIWVCLVEDSALFLRYVLERLTRDHQEQMFKLLRHLIRFVPRLPQQAAFALYNYIIGYVMFYVRSSHEYSQQLVGSALSILWMVVHSVHGIMFKDLKQILRKEQCDASILLTANVPSAKKIIVHGPEDEGGIPSQFPVQEDTQFCQLLRESLDFFGIDEKLHLQHFLIDYRSQQILNPNWYVRDLYFFKRSQYPQLRLIEMKQEDAFNLLQKQELIRKFVEIGKVHLTWAILKNVDMVVQRVVFLHEELMKLPSFPRKALEADLDLYQGGELGKSLLGLDVLHKFMWVRLIARMFEAMAGNFAYSADIQLFLNVLSGAALLHSEDSCIMRYVMATFINAAFNFKSIFSNNGYFMIMPTLLQIYSLHQTNKLVTTTIEYAVKQFYLMNRKPFILQMFGSVSAILDTDEEGLYGEAHKVQSSCLFNLLLSLETPSPDPLNIAELVKEPKPLKAIDFCYHDEDEMVTVLHCINLCVMVVSYSADSTRGFQMLIILEAILPCYMQQIQLPSYVLCEGKSERDIILQLAVAVRTMVHNSEGLSKSYTGPYRNSPEHKGSSQRNCSRAPCSPGLDFDDESHSKYVSDMGRAKNNVELLEDSEMIRAEYRRPRDVLLSIVADFVNRASIRLGELSKKQGGDAKVVELLDVKCHVRLADIAHALLKVSPYDAESMACRGLQRYMQYVLPRAEWFNDAMRPGLVTFLRRLDKVFMKISKKPSIRRNTDWEAAAGLLKGVHETVVRYPYVLHWQNIKTFFTTVQNLIVNEPGNNEGISSAGAALMSQSPPAFFCSTVVRLISLQVVCPGDCLSLEHVCGGSAEFPTQEKAEGFLMHLLMPLCLKVCSGRGVSEIGELKQHDVQFLVTAILNAMSPPAGRTGQGGQGNNRGGVDIRAGSLTFTGSRDAKRPAKISSSLYQAAFLALRILCICFEARLATEWPKMVRVMRDLGRRNEAAPQLWSFLEFVVTQRTPLYIVLMPFILHKISQPPIGDHERHMQFLIRERMRGMAAPCGIKSRGALLLELARELRDLRDELEERRYDRDVPDVNQPRREISQVAIATEVPKHQQRPSLISIFTGSAQQTASHVSSNLQDSRSGTVIGTPSESLSQQTLHPPRESLSSSSTTTNNEGSSVNQTVVVNTSAPHMSHSISLQQQPFKSQPPKLRFVSSVEFRHSSGETSTTPLSPDSPTEDSSGELHKPRLQRSKAQSRRTFRLRRGRQSHGGEVLGHTLVHEPEPAIIKPVCDLSWDSVSQTSSTSGYKDNNSIQTGLLSPDLSLSGATIGRSLSQHSLLMLFETQDEDTLI